MINKKGFTLIEILVSLTIASFFVYLVIFMPTRLLGDYKEYTKFSQETLDENILRKSILKDLTEFNVELNGNDLKLGNNYYQFTPEGVYRTSNNNKQKITNMIFNVELNTIDDILIIENKNRKMTYNVKSNFDKYEERGALNEE